MLEISGTKEDGCPHNRSLQVRSKYPLNIALQVCFIMDCLVKPSEEGKVKACLALLTKRLYAGFYRRVALCILNRLQVVNMLIVFVGMRAHDCEGFCAFSKPVKTLSGVHGLLPYIHYITLLFNLQSGSYPLSFQRSDLGVESIVLSASLCICLIHTVFMSFRLKFSCVTPNIHCVLLAVFHGSCFCIKLALHSFGQ